MPLKIRIYYLLLLTSLFLPAAFARLQAQQSLDSSACLIRYKKGETASFRIPLTKFCFVNNAGIGPDGRSGWVMKWDIVEKPGSCLLFMEMNSTDSKGWMVNGDISGSMQLVFELPSFSDSIVLTKLSNKTRGLSVINNYGGGVKKEYLNGELIIRKQGDSVLVTAALNLLTKGPDTKQQFILSRNPVQVVDFAGYQRLENEKDSIREAEKEKWVEALTTVITIRDSIWEAEQVKIKDSLKSHPYTGKFRFWVSQVNKPEYSRTTYVITTDSLFIKEGPYDFIYLARNYSSDSVYYRRALNKKEKLLLAGVEQRIGADSLESYYRNRCFMDGLILSFDFESARFSKEVTVENHYNESMAFVIGFINKICPSKYRLWYDKEALLKWQAECKR